MLLLAAAVLAGAAGCAEPAAPPAVERLEVPTEVLWGDAVRVAVTLAADGPARLDVRVAAPGQDAAGTVAARLEVPAGARAAEASFLPDRPGTHTLHVGGRSADVLVRVALDRGAAGDAHDAPGEPATKRPTQVEVPAGHEVWRRTIHGTEVVVAAHPALARAGTVGGAPVLPPARLADIVFAAFDRHWHVFGGYPDTHVTWFLEDPGAPCPTSDDRAVAHLCAPAGSAAPHPATEGYAEEWLFHEVFHHWSQGVFWNGGDGPGVLQASSWFAEGATVYYAARGRAEAASLDGYRAGMRGSAALAGGRGGVHDLDFAQLAARTAPERPGGPPPPGPYTDLLYARGALVALALDAELAAQGHDLDEVMRALYNGGIGRQGYTNEDLERVVEDLTGRPWTAFFDEHVRGVGDLPAQALWVDHVRHRVQAVPDGWG